MRRLPPMNTLRAFEAAARLLSFTRAAEELHVTQAAISHQIKALETAIGVRLFRRLNRSLLMTEAGQRYLPVVRDALDALRDATEALTRQDESGVLTVSTVPSFAATWLVPRLTRFRAAHPEIDIRISAADEIIDLERNGVDMGIRYGSGNYPGLRRRPAFKRGAIPRMQPAAGQRRTASAANTRGLTLPHTVTRRDICRLASLAQGDGGRRR